MRLLRVMVLLLVPIGAEAQEHHPDDPAHWYDMACCNRRDCEPSPIHVVDVQDGGVQITLNPGDHSNMGPKTLSRFFPWDDDKLRHSQDGDWHVCANYYRVICVYQPQGGM